MDRLTGWMEERAELVNEAGWELANDWTDDRPFRQARLRWLWLQERVLSAAVRATVR